MNCVNFLFVFLWVIHRYDNDKEIPETCKITKAWDNKYILLLLLKWTSHRTNYLDS